MSKPDNTTEHQLPKGWVIGMDGKAIHIDNMDPVDKARDKLVKKGLKKAQKMREIMEVFRGEIDTDIDMHMEAMFAEHGKKLGGKSGSLKLISYDGLLKMQRSVSGTLKFDERVHVALKIMADVISEQRGTKMLKTLIQSITESSNGNEFDVVGLSKLAKHKFDNKEWMEACNLIHQSRYYVGKKPYIRFYIRNTVDEQFTPISLDMAKI